MSTSISFFFTQLRVTPTCMLATDQLSWTSLGIHQFACRDTPTNSCPFFSPVIAYYPIPIALLLEFTNSVEPNPNTGTKPCSLMVSLSNHSIRVWPKILWRSFQESQENSTCGWTTLKWEWQKVQVLKTLAFFFSVKRWESECEATARGRKLILFGRDTATVENLGKCETTLLGHMDSETDRQEHTRLLPRLTATEKMLEIW